MYMWYLYSLGTHLFVTSQGVICSSVSEGTSCDQANPFAISMYIGTCGGSLDTVATVYSYIHCTILSVPADSHDCVAR